MAARRKIQRLSSRAQSVRLSDNQAARCENQDKLWKQNPNSYRKNVRTTTYRREKTKNEKKHYMC